MTTDEKIRAMTMAMRLLSKAVAEAADDDLMFRVLRILEGIDDEPKKPAKCEHKNWACCSGWIAEWEMFRCSQCGTLGRKKAPDASIVSPIEWWPEVTT